MTLTVLIGNGSWYPVGTPPTITGPSSLPSGSVNVAYTSTTFTATGDATITWSVTSGTLPSGMSLSSGGVLSGTPTASFSGNITFTATNSSGTSSRPLSLLVTSETGPTALTAPLISVWKAA